MNLEQTKNLVENLNVWNSSKRQVGEYLRNFGEVKDLEHKFIKVNDKETDLVVEYTRDKSKLKSRLRLPFDIERDEDYKVILYIHEKCSLAFKTEIK